MRKLFILIGLFVAISLSGQVVQTNVVYAQPSEGGDTPPAYLIDGNTFAWYISDSTATITKDGTDSLRIWADYLASGNDLTCTDNTTKQPIWSVDGVLFNGTTNTITTGAKTLNQPYTLYMVVKQVTWTSLDAFCDGFLGSAMYIRQHTSSARVSANAGAYTTDNNSLGLDTWGIVIATFNGNNSFLMVNDTDNGVEAAGANNAGGFTLGSNGGGTNYFGNIQVKEVYIRKKAYDATEISQGKAYLKAKYGL